MFTVEDVQNGVTIVSCVMDVIDRLSVIRLSSSVQSCTYAAPPVSLWHCKIGILVGWQLNIY